MATTERGLAESLTGPAAGAQPTGRERTTHRRVPEIGMAWTARSRPSLVIHGRSFTRRRDRPVLPRADRRHGAPTHESRVAVHRTSYSESYRRYYVAAHPSSAPYRTGSELQCAGARLSDMGGYAVRPNPHRPVVMPWLMLWGTQDDGTMSIVEGPIEPSSR